ncbi:MAG: VOC family protein [Vicinamibacterales bacterium]
MTKSVRRRKKSPPVTRRRPARRPARSVTGASVAVEASGVAPGMQSLSAYLAVANVAATLEFLEKVMGFARGVALADVDGRLRYAEVRHGDAVLMLVRRGDELSPSHGAPALYAYVTDVDRALAHARDAGAAVGDIEDKPWGDRVGSVIDPDGYRWLLATFKKLVPFAQA